jgi:hypothetical protein
MEIEILGRRSHNKASEEYVDVRFTYSGQIYEWSIPIEYRRTGTSLADSSEAEIRAYVVEVYELAHPDGWPAFREEQTRFWDAMPKKAVTRGFFDAMLKSLAWVKSEEFPSNNNPQRRIQDIKELGYTLATKFENGKTSHLLLPIPRGGTSGYETWSPELRRRIVGLLNSIDVYENARRNPNSLIPDHKFPEIRWDNTVKRNSLADLTDEEIKRDFQLVNNQRNQQKREACRSCFQSGIRPDFLGIKYFYSGNCEWDPDTPIRGKKAELGCVGCGWYDMEKWRNSLNSLLDEG